MLPGSPQCRPERRQKSFWKINGIQMKSLFENPKVRDRKLFAVGRSLIYYFPHLLLWIMLPLNCFHVCCSLYGLAAANLECPKSSILSLITPWFSCTNFINNPNKIPEGKAAAKKTNVCTSIIHPKARYEWVYIIYSCRIFVILLQYHEKSRVVWHARWAY